MSDDSHGATGLSFINVDLDFERAGLTNDDDTFEGISRVLEDAGGADLVEVSEVLMGTAVFGFDVGELFTTHARSCRNSCRVTRNFLQEEEPAL